jgi:xanthine dehydrogenase accessory factor
MSPDPNAPIDAALPRNVDVNAAMTTWLAAGHPIAEAIVIEAVGASPVPVGGRMVVAGEDAFIGSVSGGCIEADVIVTALDVIAGGAPQTVTFGIADQVAWRAGLPCGSTIRVAVVPLDRAAAAMITDAHRSARSDRQPRIIATRLRDGRRTVYTQSDSDRPVISPIFHSGESAIVAIDGEDTFCHHLTPPPRIVIIGATHVAQILTVMATAAGYETIIVDPRSAFTSTSRFDAETAVTDWPEKVIVPYARDAATAIVTLTHIGHIDDEALKIALRSACIYIGALGSRRTHAARVDRLKAAGFSDADIARIRAPVGLNIGGRAPGEIAVAILAEIVASFNKKTAP